MRMLRTIVIEDVPLMRDVLIDALRAIDSVAIVGVAESVAEGMLLLRREPCDVLFLDVHLPDGFGVSLGDAASEAAAPPHIVYCTADPAFALDAIRQDAVDYLLKPVSPEALARALGRVRRRQGAASPPPPLEVRDGSRVRYIAIDLIERVEAAGHYQCVHSAGEVHLLRQSFGQVAEQLGVGFVRVHRSLLVRVAAIRALKTERSGDGVLTLESGTRARFSRSFREDIEAALRKG